MISSWFKSNRPRDLIGMEINSTQIKMLIINTNISPYKIEACYIASLPSGAVVKDDIKDTQVVSSVIIDMIKASGIKAKDVALSIPRSSAIVKNITIDSQLGESDIEARAWVEANRHFPDLVGDIYLDFSLLGPAPHDKTQLEYVLVACRKDQIKPYQEVFKQSGLIAKIIDVDSFALQRALSIIDKPSDLKTCALLNLNFNLSTLIVIDQHNLIYAHDQSFDGSRLLNEVQKITEEEARIKYLKDNLSPHLRHAMHFFFSSRPNITIQQLYLSGDCSLIPKVETVIKQEIGIETVIADPFVKMQWASYLKANEFKKNASALMLCCGLALSKIDI